MVGVVRPNDLGGLSSADPSSEMVLVATGGDVRELQRTLWACAKRSPERRFHALYDRIWRSDVLQQATRLVLEPIFEADLGVATSGRVGKLLVIRRFQGAEGRVEVRKTGGYR